MSGRESSPLGGRSISRLRGIRIKALDQGFDPGETLIHLSESTLYLDAEICHRDVQLDDRPYEHHHKGNHQSGPEVPPTVPVAHAVPVALRIAKPASESRIRTGRTRRRCSGRERPASSWSQCGGAESGLSANPVFGQFWADLSGPSAFHQCSGAVGIVAPSVRTPVGVRRRAGSGSGLRGLPVRAHLFDLLRLHALQSI